LDKGVPVKEKYSAKEPEIAPGTFAFQRLAFARGNSFHGARSIKWTQINAGSFANPRQLICKSSGVYLQLVTPGFASVPNPVSRSPSGENEISTTGFANVTPSICSENPPVRLSSPLEKEVRNP
jgi:hypothetical protein